jgi:hypothetical protein
VEEAAQPAEHVLEDNDIVRSIIPRTPDSSIALITHTIAWAQ